MNKYSNGDDDIIHDLYNNSPLVLFHIWKTSAVSGREIKISSRDWMIVTTIGIKYDMHSAVDTDTMKITLHNEWHKDYGG